MTAYQELIAKGFKFNGALSEDDIGGDAIRLWEGADWDAIGTEMIAQGREEGPEWCADMGLDDWEDAGSSDGERAQVIVRDPCNNYGFTVASDGLITVWGLN